jgi:hypothetical protein
MNKRYPPTDSEMLAITSPDLAIPRGMVVRSTLFYVAIFVWLFWWAFS